MDVAQYELVSERVRSALSLGGGDLFAVCDTCVRALPVRRVAILIDEPHLGVQPWAASDERGAEIEAAQATAGEGPAFEAVTSGNPVVVAGPRDGGERWPVFAAAMRRLSVADAVLAVPLCAGAIRIGAFDLYGEAGSAWTPELSAVAVEVADLIAAHLVSANYAPPPTSTLIHEAAGRVIAQRAAEADAAYTWLRAEALRRELTLADCAERIIDHRIRVDAP